MSFDNFNTDVRKRFRERVGEYVKALGVRMIAKSQAFIYAYPSGSRNSSVWPICRDATVLLQESGAVYACFTMMDASGRTHSPCVDQSHADANGCNVMIPIQKRICALRRPQKRNDGDRCR
jgi:hypothetical protein